ncbi:MAG TPA: ThuA domain-containing protein [Pirellulales bacterium]|nr:ThuA domain-containing protein [Pirellulales bacterium]
MLRRFFTLLALCSAPVLGLAPAADARAEGAIKARYFTGGGYHDYKALAPVVTEGISRHALVEWDIRFGQDELAGKNVAEGADVLVYNMCYDDGDPDVIERLLSITRAGKPTVLVHCSMHSFKATDAWTDCCGQRTRKHDAYRPFSTAKVDAEHPIVKTFPDHWKTPGDELYQSIKLADDSHPLLMAKGEENRENIVCWFHHYGQGRVFATTLGHDMKTAAQDDYHKLLASGLLWACDKLADDGQPRAGYGPAKKAE